MCDKHSDRPPRYQAGTRPGKRRPLGETAALT